MRPKFKPGLELKPLIQTLCASAALLALPAPGVGETSTPVELNLTPLPSGHLSVDVRLNGEGPYPFVIDTAASHTAIIEPVASAFGYVPETAGVSDVQTLTEEITTERFRFDSVALPGVQAHNIDAVVVGAPMGASLPIQGLLGNDVLDGQRLEIDYAARSLILGGERPDHVDGLIDSEWGVLVAEGRISRARQPVRVLIDTGASRTIVNARLARWAMRRSASLRVRVGGASRLAEQVDTEGVAQVVGLRVGGLCLPDFRAIESDVDIFRALGWENEPAIVLGMDVLQHTVLTIDHAEDVFQIDPAGDLGQCPGRRRIQIHEDS